jgi:hypothetical protein
MAIVPYLPGCTMERMLTSPYVICLGAAERAELESVSRRASAPFHLVIRSRIVLLAAAARPEDQPAWPRRTNASLCQVAAFAFFGAFLVAECGRRLAAPPGRSSSLRCGRSTWTCGFAVGGMAAIEEGQPCPGSRAVDSR